MTLQCGFWELAVLSDVSSLSCIAYARDHQPCIIFMDEIDAIGGKRFSEGTSADREIQRTLMEVSVTMSPALYCCMHVCMYVCMYVRIMHACTYVCMYVRTWRP